MPDPVISLADVDDPEQQVLIADSVGLALQIVLDTLAPAERLAFVLHDVFRVPFAEIAKILDRSEVATQQLASRARRQVQGSPAPDRDLQRQREVVDAFFKASHDGDFRTLWPCSIPRSNYGSTVAYSAAKPRSSFGAAEAVAGRRPLSARGSSPL